MIIPTPQILIGVYSLILYSNKKKFFSKTFFPGPEFLFHLNFQCYDLLWTSWAILNPHSILSILILPPQLCQASLRKDETGEKARIQHPLQCGSLDTIPALSSTNPGAQVLRVFCFNSEKGRHLTVYSSAHSYNLPLLILVPETKRILPENMKLTVESSSAKMPCDQGPLPWV